jgi:hypothetical protein
VVKRRFYMKKSRFSDSQILAVLKQAEAGTPVPDRVSGDSIPISHSDEPYARGVSAPATVP